MRRLVPSVEPLVVLDSRSGSCRGSLKVVGPRIIRRVTTFLLVALSLVVLLFAWRGASRKSHPPTGSTPPKVTEDTVGIYHAFEHLESVAGVKVFALRADRTVGSRSGYYDLETVNMVIYRRGTPAAAVASRRARFNKLDKRSEVEGSVHVLMPDGTFLQAPRGRFDPASKRLRLSGGVNFGAPGLVGRCRSVEFAVEARTLIMRSKVRVTSENGLVLQADLSRFDQRSGKLEFPEGAVVEASQSRLEMAEATANVEKAGGIRSLDALDARFGVSIPALIEGISPQLVLSHRTGKQWQLRATMDGDTHWVEISWVSGPEGVERVLRTWELVAVLEEGKVVSAVTSGATCIMDGPGRSASLIEAKDGKYYFQDNLPVDAEFVGDVEFYSGPLHASAQLARYAVLTGILILKDPTQVSISVPGSKAWAGEVTISTTEGWAELSDQVQGITELGLDGGEPARFACSKLRIKGRGEEVQLKGRARLWQAERLLLADSIQLVSNKDAVEAAGSVRATLPSEDGELLVVASFMRFLRSKRQASFKGGVRLTSANEMLSAASLDLLLDKSGQVKAFKAEGHVVVEQLASGRRMTGSSAVYDAASGTMVVSGTPAMLEDSEGNVTSGTKLTWFRTGDRVTVEGGEETPTETIYHPEVKTESQSSGPGGGRAP